MTIFSSFRTPIRSGFFLFACDSAIWRWPHNCLYTGSINFQKNMKGILLTGAVLLTLTSCDFYVEPRYDVRDRVVGKFFVDEYSQTYNNYASYTIYISKAYSYDEVIIDNFYANGLQARAYISSSKITIPYQVVKGYEIEGTGTVFGDNISLTYSIRDLYRISPTDFCNVEASLIYR